ncbi:MAG: PAS domain S-box protein [Chthoniobacter sp.]|uniref:PAS domain-containing sensor histidine kinase n=1 Tax=Chthoniobacter sp. TaxID=2510640 RepID=UPI0032ACEF31
MLHLVEEARANLADQYDYAPIGFLTLDAQGCVREVNVTAARLLGRERVQLIGMPFLSHIARGHWKEFLHHMSECRRRPTVVVSDLDLRARDRRTLHVELRSVPVLDARRDETVYRTAMTEIGERLRVAQALEESERRHRDMVESSPDGIFIQSDGVIVFANRVALDLCGVKEVADLHGRELTGLLRPAYRQSVASLLVQVATGRETPSMEVKIERGSGTPVHVELAARNFHFEGEPAVLVMARDITPRKIAERHVLAISERERRAFGRDLHDSICQSLMGTACLAEALRNKLRKSGLPAASDAEEIGRVARQCLDEARNMARGLCPVAMEKSGLVTALHELTAEVARHTRIECLLECDESLAIGDPNVATNLYRITQEAVSNAIKHGRARSVLIRLAAGHGRPRPDHAPGAG